MVLCGDLKLTELLRERLIGEVLATGKPKRSDCGVTTASAISRKEGFGLSLSNEVSLIVCVHPVADPRAVYLEERLLARVDHGVT